MHVSLQAAEWLLCFGVAALCIFLNIRYGKRMEEATYRWTLRLFGLTPEQVERSHR